MLTKVKLILSVKVFVILVFCACAEKKTIFSSQKTVCENFLWLKNSGSDWASVSSKTKCRKFEKKESCYIFQENISGKSIELLNFCRFSPHIKHKKRATQN